MLPLNRPAWVRLQIVDALKTSEGGAAPYIVYAIRFEVSLAIPQPEAPPPQSHAFN